MRNAFIVLLIIFGWSCDRPNRSIKTVFSSPDTAGYSLKAIDDLHERLTLNELDKGLMDFINSSPNKVDSIRKVVYLLPVGNMRGDVEEILRSEVNYLRAFLQLEVKILGRISYDSIKKMPGIKTRMVPGVDFDNFSKLKGGIPALAEQIDATSFVNIVMRHSKPNDAIAVLGITEHDIYNDKYNYLFGISGLKDGLGLVSTFRLIDYGEDTKYNIRKVVSKQIVNMFSIPNVKDFKCVLNFHNGIDELYLGKFDLSPRALEKLKYSIGFDYSKRFEELRAFWEDEHDITEQRYYEMCLARLK